MMKFLLIAVNAKYIHSNPGVYSLKVYAEHVRERKKSFEKRSQGGAGLAGTGLLPAYGNENEVQIEIAEYTINNQMEQMLEDVYRRRPDAVGISCYIWNVAYVLELIHDLHKVLPQTDIWLGGPEVSFDAPQLLAREPELLGILKGEGEETFAGLLECYGRLAASVRAASVGQDQSVPEKDFWNSLSGLSGLAYRDAAGHIHDQPVRPVIDMSQIPFLYRNLDGFEHRIVYYESSRGCPFSCSYCLSSIDKSVRFRDLELVKRELDFFLEKQVPQVKFVDRTFNCRKSHAMAIWKHIHEHDNGVTNFHFEVAADLLGQEELQLISRMRPGLIQLEIGVQSTNPDTIREIRRNMDLEQVKAVVAQINAGHNVHQHLDLIAGLPYEDYASFRRSFNEVYAMEPEQLQLGFLKVLKGSHMYEKTKEYDLVYRQMPPYEVLSTRWLPYGDVLKLKGVEAMVEAYYNSGQFANTLKLLQSEFEDAFGMYEALAGYYEKQGFHGHSHSRMARYEILHEFIETVLHVRKPAALADCQASLADYQDALICDMYLRENCKSRPSFALDQAPYKEQIRRLVPELRALGTQVHVEVLRSGQIRLFDYRKKDPLTRNAAWMRLA